MEAPGTNSAYKNSSSVFIRSCNTLQHTATLHNTLQHTHNMEAPHANFACTSSSTISVRSCNTLQQSETHCNTLTRWRRLARTQHIEALLRFPSAADRRVFSWHLVEGCFEDLYSSFADMHIPLVVWRTRRLFYKDTGLWIQGGEDS